MKPGPALAALLLLASCKPRPPATLPVAKARQATVFLTADLRGYLGPCGCSENMRGGFPKAAFQVLEARKTGAPVLVLDAGDALFGHPTLEEAAVPQEERKARALAQGFKLLGLQARAVGELDDARGPAFRAALGLSEVPASGVQLLDAGGQKVAAVTGATADALKKAAASARSRGAGLVLGLVHLDLARAQPLANEDLGVDLVVLGHSEGEFGAEENQLVRARTPIVRAQSKGRSLVKVDVTFGGKPGERFSLLPGQAELERELTALDQRIELLRAQVNEPSLQEEAKRLRQAKLDELVTRRETLASRPPPSPEGTNAFSVRFLPLEASFPEAPEAKALVTAYDRDVGTLNLAWAKAHGRDCPPPAPGKAAFAGNGACLDCHEETFPVWKASKHAHAYGTLESVGKNLHLDCVRCHVTGFEAPGGVCRLDRVEGRQDVGCESCHGPGSLHAQDPTQDNVVTQLTPAACVGCHDRENSPHFEFESFRAQILGPGHGQPLPGAQKPKRR